MLGRILDRSRQVIELFRALRRPARDERVVAFAPPPPVATKPQPLHVSDVVLGG